MGKKLKLRPQQLQSILQIEEAQLVGINDEQILSKIDNVLKLARDTTISPLGQLR